SGADHSVQDLVECAFDHVGLDWRKYVRADRALQRGTAELRGLVGDPSRARDQLRWQPEVDFEGLVRLLVDADIALVRSIATPATSMERRRRTSDSSRSKAWKSETTRRATLAWR